MRHKNQSLPDPIKLVPYGLVATRAWLLMQCVKPHKVDNWVKSGKLVSLVPGVFMRPDTQKLAWQGIVCSLQRMGAALAPGGLTALELQGLEHYLALAGDKTIQLYGPDMLPAWANKILPGTVFVHHHAQRLFGGGDLKNDVYGIMTEQHDSDPLHGFSRSIAWGLDEWPMSVSTPERAIFEVLLDVPEHISFEHADQLMQGLMNLSPHRLNRLLERCTSIKVKRLFLWLAERHQHPWLKKLALDKFSMESGTLGSGKRMLAIGGRLDAKYLITVPEELHGSA